MNNIIKFLLISIIFISCGSPCEVVKNSQFTCTMIKENENGFPMIKIVEFYVLVSQLVNILVQLGLVLIIALNLLCVIYLTNI
ncbi:hypothetical protein COB55_03420 [Candidatus Wolfebacteria bacterium]|nr:MAG: hypothetical protein COB55_03420 [Candidatus Wolfebacteria bacterium]